MVILNHFPFEVWVRFVDNHPFFKLIYLKFPLRIDLLNVVSLYIETLVFFR